MPSKKKKFIDKKNAVTFTVVHRSQKDPKIADEDAPQRVLVSSRHEEQLKYGIEYDDDYDYLQHLKDVRAVDQAEAETFRIERPLSEMINNVDKRRLLLPSAVFASNFETEVGLLNKNIPLIGPQPDLDPDILAALDGDIQSDEELDDNFVSFANAQNDEINSDDDSNSLSDSMSNSSDDHDKQSRFTGYSMTSSVIRRNANLQLIDSKFEKFYEKFKNDEEEDLDEFEDEDAAQNDEVLHQLIDQYKQKENSKALEMQEFIDKAASLNVNSNSLNPQKVQNMQVNEIASSSDESSEEELERIKVEVPDHDWDCESIISTYSTTRNQPQIVNFPPKKPIKPVSRHQIPEEVILSIKNKNSDDEEELPKKSIPQIVRNKNETKEEKLARKQMVKNFRRERRQQKSQTKEFFKDEELRIKKQLINFTENCVGAVHLQ